ncbi:MAG: glycosyltransferase [bacterium]|nr:glycosyltransferase [bacterium]
MKVLTITGDKSFGPGNPRYDLQRSQVEELAVVYWGRGSLWPKIPWGHFDVVTAQDPFWRGHFAGHVARLLGTKLNLQVHTDLSALSWLSRRQAAFNLRKADSIRVVSEKIKKQVEGMGVRVPMHVLPVYVDVERFRGLTHQPFDQAQDKPQNKKTILWVGRFEDEKDPLYAVHVLEEVRESGIDATLVMLGTGALEPGLRQRAKVLPIELPGWQDPKPYLQGADVVLSTSRHESWGASIVEALASGVPVVAPDVGVAREAGAIVVPREQLAETVVDVLKKGTRGTLRLELPNAPEWARRWKETLL